MTEGDQEPVTKSTFHSELSKLSSAQVFGNEFLAVYGSMDWIEDKPNRAAAHKFRTTLISRIATARLPYGSGTEKRALESVVELFKNAREITAENVGCGTFEILVWHALNSVVRPFTAKWHPLSNAGALEALDATDDFRAELYDLQIGLRELERALARLQGADATSYDPSPAMALGNGEERSPMAKWRPAGNIADFKATEEEAVISRRRSYVVETEQDSAAGLALSGGGIRSATFSLGVLAALARRNLLPQFDYLSTVSGGGYTGCFLASLLGKKNLPEDMGLESEQQPFKRNEQESDLLMGVRQRASFLSAGFVERLLLVMRSTYGVFVNVLLLFGMIAFFAAGERSVKSLVDYYAIPSWVAWICPVFALAILAFVARTQKLGLEELNGIHGALGAVFCLPLVWKTLQTFHSTIFWLAGDGSTGQPLDGLSAAILVAAILIAILGAISAVYVKMRSAAVIGIAIVFLLFVEHSFYVVFSDPEPFHTAITLAVIAASLLLLWLWVDVNETSLHRYYRSKLATAFIHVAVGNGPPKVSEIECSKTLYPIINCALNAPGSKQPRMRGRLADVFSFTPHMTGSNLIGYSKTSAWEVCNPLLDLASAMALSGAAVSPQMGLRTTRRSSFWLTLFNARLNAWLRDPQKVAPKAIPPTDSFFVRNGPGLGYLVHEFWGNADESLPYSNISDGGHIENLGVYELLRRRCRYIVAVDGEADPKMTFHALTNLQRLAYIDMGIQIDVDLDELRLQDSGFSRSHFRFCRIRYPTGNNENPWEIGHLLYVKLSLTGNEGEFLKRYRLDEPMFPHHSTADQFFSETQFEAYRALGEHVGDKLFMKAIIGELAKKRSIKLDKWMNQYAENFPMRSSVDQPWERDEQHSRGKQ
ncbi:MULTISPECIES: patatin-like phospholipase family protein [unclassified Ochrobactrum]|uniref:patatin-like phospholipase family protein n=1 Tax=unclassified Ochrobactrum TaxID=239106 RepID=UPI0025712F8D|nr:MULTISPECIES: patatin-like phospholipase family protein [unclassified Ochrobactrum]